MIAGVEYLSAGNQGNDPDDQLRRDFQFFRDHGITYVQVRMVLAGVWNGEVLRQTAVDNYVRYVRMAEEVGIKLGITPLWTQPPHDTSSGNAFYPSWVGNYTNIHSNATVKARLLDYVEDMAALLDSPAVAFWQTLNEPYGSDRNSQAQMISDIAARIRSVSDKPVSCRFICGWNPATSRWSSDGSTWNQGSYFPSTLLDDLDFLSLTIYLDPATEGFNPSSRSNWAELKQIIANSRARSKQVYVVEFGKSTGSYGNVCFTEACDETQRLHYERVITERFVPYGLNSCAGWAWQSRSWTLENYNICKGIAAARPAFGELQKVSDEPVVCLTDNDCPPGYICIDGECVPETPPPPPVFTCPTCGATFATQAELDAHIANQHPPKPFVCTVCGAAFGTQPTLFIHVSGFHFLCAICSDSGVLTYFGTKAELDAHIAAEHPTPPPPPPPPPCFIATAAYGSPLAKELDTFRKFRDKCLPDQLVEAYYKKGPVFADYIRKHKRTRYFTRETLDMMEKVLRRD